MEYIILSDLISFDWAEGNQGKNWREHRVSKGECEQLFFNKPLLFYKDIKHSLVEKRNFALGTSDAGRKLFVSFTLRKKTIRIISARDMSKKERKIYEKI